MPTFSARTDATCDFDSAFAIRFFCVFDFCSVKLVRIARPFKRAQRRTQVEKMKKLGKNWRSSAAPGTDCGARIDLTGFPR